MSSVRVYKYGLRPPTQEVGRVHEQLWKAHLYRNDLVQIECARRSAVRTVLGRYGDIAVLDQAVRTAEETLRVAKAAARAERVALGARRNTPPVAEAVTRAKTTLSAARVKVTAARRAAKLDPAAVRELGIIEERAGELRRSARGLASDGGLYWGTYQLVEESMQQASRKPLYNGLKPNDPRFHRHVGEGQVSVQVMGGLLPGEVSECTDTRVRLEPIADRRKDKDRFRILHLRVGSNADRGPIWALFPLKMHRPLPEGATIKRVTVELRRRGPKAEWAALFTLEMPSAELFPRGARSELQRCGQGSVAIDLGWRRLRDGSLRVATTYDGKTSGELRLGAYTLDSFRKVEGLTAVRDKLLLTAIAVVREVRSIAPAWFKTRTEYVHQWRSEARMASLVGRWTRERFAGDEAAFAAVTEWRQRDVHLWWYESGASMNVHRRRRQVYRVYAADLARRYGTLVLEDFDLSTMAREPAVGRDNQQAELARWQRRVAATSELRGCLIDAFAARGGKVIKVNAAETTMTCNQCKIVEVFDAAARIRHTCTNGHEWDQDENAAKNILERSRGGKAPAPARKPPKPKDSGPEGEKRWARARRMSREKQDRLATARGTPPSPA